MRAIGNTKLDENDNIGALLGHLPNQTEKTAVNRTELTTAENKPEKTQALEENVNAINLNTADLPNLLTWK